MTNYKFHLRKSSAKEICPNCGRKTFVPYVDANGGLVGEEYGRCDREQKCGYFRYPHGVASCITSEPADLEKKPELQFYPNAYKFGENGLRSNLYLYALTACSPMAVERISHFFNAYNIQKYKDYIIFPQIDEFGKLRTAKMIKYQDNGHRSHDRGASTWLHAIKSATKMHNGGELRQCFFGQHLLNKKNFKELYGCELTADTPIYVVESEKTALLMAIHSRSVGVWLACGGSQMLKNSERNEILKGRNVTLIPDQGQFFNWKTTADKNGWKIISSIEHFRWCGIPNPPSTEGWDIWDIVEFLIQFKR